MFGIAINSQISLRDKSKTSQRKHLPRERDSDGSGIREGARDCIPIETDSKPKIMRELSSVLKHIYQMEACFSS